MPVREDADATGNPRGGTFADIFTLRIGTSSAQPVTRSANLDGWPSWGRAKRRTRSRHTVVLSAPCSSASHFSREQRPRLVLRLLDIVKVDPLLIGLVEVGLVVAAGAAYLSTRRTAD